MGGDVLHLHLCLAALCHVIAHLLVYLGWAYRQILLLHQDEAKHVLPTFQEPVRLPLSMFQSPQGAAGTAAAAHRRLAKTQFLERQRLAAP